MGSLLALLSFCSSVLLPFCLKNNNLFMSYQFKSLSPVPSVGEGEERYDQKDLPAGVPGSPH